MSVLIIVSHYVVEHISILNEGVFERPGGPNAIDFCRIVETVTVCGENTTAS